MMRFTRRLDAFVNSVKWQSERHVLIGMLRDYCWHKLISIFEISILSTIKGRIFTWQYYDRSIDDYALYAWADTLIMTGKAAARFIALPLIIMAVPSGDSLYSPFVASNMMTVKQRRRWGMPLFMPLAHWNIKYADDYHQMAIRRTAPSAKYSINLSIHADDDSFWKLISAIFRASKNIEASLRMRQTSWPLKCISNKHGAMPKRIGAGRPSRRGRQKAYASFRFDAAVWLIIISPNMK